MTDTLIESDILHVVTDDDREHCQSCDLREHYSHYCRSCGKCFGCCECE